MWIEVSGGFIVGHNILYEGAPPALTIWRCSMWVIWLLVGVVISGIVVWVYKEKIVTAAKKAKAEAEEALEEIKKKLD
jgi:phosphate/sulfate permease